ncbi:MAG TPA: glycosyltransferase family 4 protein [Bryobacterales bacterium]|nr:glycosyltransferase family 4 protein [Bryobacterales bacterium]
MAPKAYVVFNPSVDGTYGGAEIALGLIARKLSCFENMDVQVLVGDYGQGDSEKAGNITLRKALDARGGALKNGRRLLSVMSDVDADVYIQRTLSIASTLIALYCRVRRRRFIYWVAHDHEADGGHPLYRRATTRLAVRALFRLASHIVVQNDYESSELQKRFPGVRCTLIRKGIELPDGASAADEVYDAVWVGRCDEWKNPAAFVRLARSNPSKRFLMICPPAFGKEEDHGRLLEEASSCANLEVRGRTKNREVLDLVRRSRIFCATSTQEGDWPVVVLEAASLKKPILSLHLRYQGLLGEYGGGAWCDGDPVCFSHEFNVLLDNAELRRTMGEGAYRYVKDIHDVKEQTVRLLNLIDELT